MLVEAESHMLRMAGQGVRGAHSRGQWPCPGLPILPSLPMCQGKTVALFKLLPAGFLLRVADYNPD